MQRDLTAGFHFSITGELISNDSYVIILTIQSSFVRIDVQTVAFPLPLDYLTLDKNRRFFVSVTDGRITKNTRAALLDRQSLNWSEILDGL